jgi:hypothetical protein
MSAGEDIKKKKGAKITNKIAMIMNSLISNIGTNNGPIKAPTPKAPCENPTHIPISSGGAALTRQISTVTIIK